MIRCRTWMLAVLLFLIMLTACNISQTHFDRTDRVVDPTGYDRADVRRGAQLYDNWLEIKAYYEPQGKGGRERIYPIETTYNPLFTRPDRTPRTTWRCKSCHGWDYRGAGWEAGTNRPKTKFPGLLSQREIEPEKVLNNIAARTSGHEFGRYLYEKDLWDLTRFIREELGDPGTVIDNNGRFKGDMQRGNQLYNRHCADCHGDSGGKLSFRSRQPGIRGIGWRTGKSPEISLHRTRWGRYRDISRKRMRVLMPSARVDLGLTDRDVVDILAYCQSLPQ